VVNYINTRRLQRVASLLASTDKNITEAAFESGFPGLANFYRRFKILYGVTPVKFRKMIEGRHQAPGERSARVSRSKDAPPLRWPDKAGRIR
jgi:AraC-like DNA-binding protein